MDGWAEDTDQYIVPTLREAAAAASRPEGAARVVAALPICVTDDVAATRAKAAEQLALYEQLPSYCAMLDREGVAGLRTLPSSVAK